MTIAHICDFTELASDLRHRAILFFSAEKAEMWLCTISDGIAPNDIFAIRSVKSEICFSMSQLIAHDGFDSN